MKEIKVKVEMAVNVTDEEAEELEALSISPYQFDCPYNNIIIPEWLYERIKKDGKVIGNGYIMKESWFKDRSLNFFDFE